MKMYRQGVQYFVAGVMMMSLLGMVSARAEGDDTPSISERCATVNSFLRGQRRAAAMGSTERDAASQAWDNFKVIADVACSADEKEKKSVELIAQNKRLFAVQKEYQCEVKNLRAHQHQLAQSAQKANELQSSYEKITAEKEQLEKRCAALEQQNMQLKVELAPLLAKSDTPTDLVATDTAAADLAAPVVA